MTDTPDKLPALEAVAWMYWRDNAKSICATRRGKATYLAADGWSETPLTDLTSATEIIAEMEARVAGLRNVLRIFEQYYDLNDCAERVGNLEIPITDLLVAKEAIAAWSRRAPVDDHPEIIGGIEAQDMTMTEAQSKSLHKAMLASFDEVVPPGANPADLVVEQMANALDNIAGNAILSRGRHWLNVVLEMQETARAALAAYRKGK